MRYYVKQSPARVVGVRKAAQLTEAQTALFDSHMYLINVLLQKFRHKLRIRRIEYDDARQVALCGLWRAASKHDPAKGMFSTLAYRCIMLSLHELAETKIRDAARWAGSVFHNLTDDVAQFLLARPDTPTEPDWIDDLPAKFVAIIRRCLAGATWPEIAQEFGYADAKSARSATGRAYNQAMKRGAA
jgi:hypothetical protein